MQVKKLMTKLGKYLAEWFRDLFTLQYEYDEEYQGEIKFPVGTIIQCPGCKAEIATSLKDLYNHDPINSRYWDNIQFESKMNCPSCAVPYFRDTGAGKQLHTTKGWM